MIQIEALWLLAPCSVIGYQRFRKCR